LLTTFAEVVGFVFLFEKLIPQEMMPPLGTSINPLYYM